MGTRFDEGTHTVSLQLVPVVPNGTGRSLPLELGRVELVTWWLTSCCRRRNGGVQRRRPCEACRSLMVNAKFLSKSMLRLDASLTMYITGKNSKCMYLNDEAVVKLDKGSGISVRRGDVLSFRSDRSSPAWMRFQFCPLAASIVTPQITKKASNKNDESSTRNSKEHSNNQDDSFARPVAKRKGNENDGQSRRSRRKLFPTPVKKANDEPVSQQQQHESITSSCEPQKRGPPNTQFPTNNASSQDSSVVSLPQCPLSEEFSESPNVSQYGIQQFFPAVTRTPPEYSVGPQPVSELSLSQWKALQRTTAPVTGVRRALVNVVVARNCSHQQNEPCLPALLQGTTISKTDVLRLQTQEH